MYPFSYLHLSHLVPQHSSQTDARPNNRASNRCIILLGNHRSNHPNSHEIGHPVSRPCNPIRALRYSHLSNLVANPTSNLRVSHLNNPRSNLRNNRLLNRHTSRPSSRPSNPPTNPLINPLSAQPVRQLNSRQYNRTENHLSSQPANLPRSLHVNPHHNRFADLPISQPGNLLHNHLISLVCNQLSVLQGNLCYHPRFNHHVYPLNNHQQNQHTILQINQLQNPATQRHIQQHSDFISYKIVEPQKNRRMLSAPMPLLNRLQLQPQLPLLSLPVMYRNCFLNFRLSFIIITLLRHSSKIILAPLLIVEVRRLTMSEALSPLCTTTSSYLTVMRSSDMEIEVEDIFHIFQFRDFSQPLRPSLWKYG